MHEWLTAGAAAAWIVDPERKTVAVHRSDQPARLFREDDELEAEEPLPGLRIAVRDVFA